MPLIEHGFSPVGQFDFDKALEGLKDLPTVLSPYQSVSYDDCVARVNNFYKFYSRERLDELVRQGIFKGEDIYKTFGYTTWDFSRKPQHPDELELFRGRELFEASVKEYPDIFHYMFIAGMVNKIIDAASDEEFMPSNTYFFEDTWRDKMIAAVKRLSPEDMENLKAREMQAQCFFFDQIAPQLVAEGIDPVIMK